MTKLLKSVVRNFFAAMREGLTVDSVRRLAVINEAKNTIKKVAEELDINDKEINAVLKEYEQGI